MNHHHNIFDFIHKDHELSQVMAGLCEIAIVAVTDLHGVIKFANNRFSEISGFSIDELIGKPHSIVNSQVHPKQFFLEMWQTIAGGSTWRADICNRRKNGELYWVDTTIIPLKSNDNKIEQYISIRFDVTKQRQNALALEGQELIKKALFESEAKQAALFDAMAEGIVIQVQGGGISRFNAAALEILGLTEGQLFGRTSMDPEWKCMKEDGSPFPGEEHPAMVALTTGKRVNNTIMRVARPDANERWILINSAPIFSDGSKTPTMVITTFLDITPTKNAREEVDRAHKELTDFLHLANDGIIFLNADNTIKLASNAITKFTGRSLDQLKGQSLKSIIAPEDWDEFANALDMVRTGKNLESIDAKTRAPNDKEIYTRWGISFNREANLIYLVGKNRNALREREMKLAQQGKMLTLSEMAAGVSHEINNPLAIIKGKASQITILLEKPQVDNQAIQKHLSTIDMTADRIAKIIKSLRTFARDAERDEIEEVSVKSIIDETISLVRTRYTSHGITLTLEDIPETTSIQCRPTQISQALYNLLGNAHDAVAEAPVRWVRVSVAQTDKFVDIMVIDSGSGVSPKIKHRIFDPFFTTKDIGKGSGLGLSAALGIAKTHGGDLFLSDQKKETTFVLRLPKT